MSLKTGEFIPVFLLLILLLSMGCEKKEIPLPDHPGGQIYFGLKRSDIRCYRCHGSRGEGSGRAPALVHQGKPIDPEVFVNIVLDGRNNMPMFRSVLTEEEILQIRDWLEKIQNP